MDKIAYIIGEQFLYWNPIILALAAVVAACTFVAIYLGSSGNPFATAFAVPMSVAASIFLARVMHWYCLEVSYESFNAAVSDYSTGGYALMGVFFGCILTALVLRLLRISRNLPQMLDAMALAGAAGIALGRLSGFYNTSDRGMLLENITELPLAYGTAHAVTGEVEYRLATFFLQSISTAAIFAFLLMFYLVGKARKKTPDGDVCLLFFLIYGCVQVVMDSTRYDSLYLRSNGFVSAVQIVSAVGIVLAIVLFSVRLVRKGGWHYWYIVLWLLIGGGLGGAGYMEYYVQRHGDQAAFAYRIMTLCLAGVILVTMLIRLLSLVLKKRKRGGKYLAVAKA